MFLENISLATKVWIKANGIATIGKYVTEPNIAFPIPINILPDKSPNLVIKVSIKTVDLYLSPFLS